MLPIQQEGLPAVNPFYSQCAGSQNVWLCVCLRLRLHYCQWKAIDNSAGTAMDTHSQSEIGYRIKSLRYAVLLILHKQISNQMYSEFQYYSSS